MRQSASRPSFILLALCAFLLDAALTLPVGADTWPQWRGPNRDGRSNETGLLQAWPEAGPPRLWKRPLGEGYPAILYKNARLYTMYRDPESEEEVVVALDADTGATIWEHRYEAPGYPEMREKALNLLR